MKKNNKYFTLQMSVLVFLLLSLTTKGIFAAVTTSPSVTAKPSTTVTPSTAAGLDNKIKELKDKLASRVAELNVVSQKVLTGEIRTLSDEKIILVADGAEINVEINSDSSYYELDREYKKKELKLEDLNTGDKVIVWGTFNSGTNTINTKNVYRQPKSLQFVGAVKGVDAKNFQVTVSSLENKDYIVDIELDTKINQYDASRGIVKLGFSKLTEGQFIYAFGLPSTSPNKKNLVSGKNLVLLYNPTSIASPTPTTK